MLSQALNAVLLLAILPFMRRLASDEAVMGRHRLGALDRAATAVVIGLVAVSVVRSACCRWRDPRGRRSVLGRSTLATRS